MNRNSIQAIIMSLVLAASLPAPLVKAAGGNVARVGEADRYATAAKVATTNWSSPKDVVLVCGEGYADAVSASVLAKQLDAPILLTNANALNGNAKNALDTLKPENVYVIGGYASISKSIRSTLTNSGYNVIELSGKNRYETNAAVANKLVELGVKADNVMLVSGEGFSDALSVAPVAAAKGQILLLGSNSSSEMKSVFDFVKANNSKVTVIGTNYAVNDTIYNKLGAVGRVNGGANRFETNINVLNAFQSDLKTDKIFVANASKDGYADALIASSLAGKWASNLVLVDGENDSATSDAVSYIKGKMSDTTDLTVIGGTGVVSDNVISRIKKTNVEPTTPDSATVKSITTVGLNQIKITFNIALDKDTAELLSNYEIDGTKLGSTYATNASATLQDDKRSVVITLSEPYDQFKNVDFKVKNGILDESTAKIISEYEQKITFSDVDKPTVTSVTAKGGNKLVIRFSEPIRIQKGDLNLLKINRQSILNFSLNKTETTLLDSSGDWADGVELYFDTALPEGNNTITFPDGNANQNYDNAAQIPMKTSISTFTIVPSNGLPKVKSAYSPNSDTLYVTYDRAMDKQTALEDSNYKLNGKIIAVDPSDMSFDEGSNDTVVKIKGAGEYIKQGENTLVVKDGVTDSYGYSIEESSITFDVEQNTAKPQITSATMIDSRTIRIKFNKPVSNGSATNKSNYKLVDNSDSEDITYKIDSIGGVSSVNGDNRDTYDLRFSSSDALKGTNYTITVKNVYDTNTPPNVMDTYTTTMDGTSGKVEITSVVRKSGSDRDVVVFFNKAMNESSISNLDNYFFIDGTGDTRKMPPNATAIPASDDRSVTLTFSSSYTIGDGTTDRYIRKIGVANVEDQEGNVLDSVAYTSDISKDLSGGPSVVDDTGKLVYDGNNIVVTFTLTDPLDVLVSSDFKVDGQSADSSVIDGKTVTLTFKGGIDKNSKIDTIRSAGARTTISVSGTASCDVAGRKIRTGSYTLLLPPTTDPTTWVADSSKGTVSLKFNQDIDKDLISSYYDDFIFTNERTGNKLNVTGVTVKDDRNIVYTFSSGSIQSGDTIDVRANDNLANINIRGKEYGNGNYAVFSPSRDDLSTRTVVAK
ncbi:cell wall-binding repeat-containing protein [Clostridium sp. PL3]|uniref:Cell wall-binding repeat-containing protein n=1 Tax=Clostridium thailandense TaxID=2794346 RepID=A0A949X1Z7_9CLOT|nr:cell wall-binding repeat-containing protein [Clostridium thailandense]MBV7272644.1 cell wall-binding repeat-containing protein [Clostridium thailandense]